MVYGRERKTCCVIKRKPQLREQLRLYTLYVKILGDNKMKSFNDNKGRFMTVTYADIRKRKDELDNKRVANVNKVIHLAETLVEEYKKSLGLEKETWTDFQGGENKYVTVGVVSNNGEFKAKKLHEIPVTGYKSIRFHIATVVDDSPRGGDVLILGVSISLSLTDENAATLYIDDPSLTSASIREDRWEDACNKIKDAVYMGVDSTETVI